MSRAAQPMPAAQGISEGRAGEWVARRTAMPDSLAYRLHLRWCRAALHLGIGRVAGLGGEVEARDPLPLRNAAHAIESWACHERPERHPGGKRAAFIRSLRDYLAGWRG